MLHLVILSGKTLCLLLGLLSLGHVPRASAQTKELIAAPNKRPPILAGELHISLMLPINDSRLCPDGAACIFGTGGAVGASFQRRWRRGIALGIGYELALQDGKGVYELTVVQSLRGLFQYAALPERWVHPLFRISAGPALIGDSFSVAAFGGVGEFQIGAEFELSEKSAAIAAFGWSLIRTRSFTSPRDGVKRATRRLFDSAATLQVGYVFYGIP